MKINTEKFGEIEINENLTFEFIAPIIGYEHLNKFALVDHMPESPFKWLQSLEDEKIAFPVTCAGFFGLDYEFIMPEDEVKKLELTNAENLLTLNIVCIPSGHPENATINLLGPLVINMDNKKAMQVVLINSSFSAKQRLFPGPKAQS
ncbi:MAG: flagellar assembly protein FliW [bacterium]